MRLQFSILAVAYGVFSGANALNVPYTIVHSECARRPSTNSPITPESLRFQRVDLIPGQSPHKVQYFMFGMCDLRLKSVPVFETVPAAEGPTPLRLCGEELIFERAGDTISIFSPHNGRTLLGNCAVNTEKLFFGCKVSEDANHEPETSWWAADKCTRTPVARCDMFHDFVCGRPAKPNWGGGPVIEEHAKQLREGKTVWHEAPTGYGSFRLTQGAAEGAAREVVQTSDGRLERRGFIKDVASMLRNVAMAKWEEQLRKWKLYKNRAMNKIQRENLRWKHYRQCKGNRFHPGCNKRWQGADPNFRVPLGKQQSTPMKKSTSTEARSTLGKKSTLNTKSSTSAKKSTATEKKPATMERSTSTKKTSVRMKKTTRTGSQGKKTRVTPGSRR
ncbi:hypothetical protein OQA88_2577 [Cercophora sp. LCS_1]